MRTRLSARSLISLAAILITLCVVSLLMVILRVSLETHYGAVNTQLLKTVWIAAAALVIVAGFGVWVVTGSILRPIRALRGDIASAAQRRSIAQHHAGETSEVLSLRTTFAAVLTELETRTSSVESEQARLLSLFETISEGIIQIGPNGRFVHANAAARMLLQLPPKPEGENPASFIRSLELREIISRSSQGEVIDPTEIVIDNRQLLLAPQPLPHVQGEKGGAVITVVDLTELRRLESVRRDFVANVSHELKTPLTSIRGYAETLLSDDMDREAQLQFLEVILKNANRIQHIIEDLLDLSRLQSGGWQPNLRIVDATALARDVWQSCEPNARKRDIRFTVTQEPISVLADPDGLRQILSNLFDNALRYTPDSGSIKVALRRGANDSVAIAVGDTGSGIPSDALPRIFERFYRVDPARSRAEGGTGLGLSIVKHLIERMDGQVSAESELGKGTVIKLQLPAPHE